MQVTINTARYDNIMLLDQTDGDRGGCYIESLLYVCAELERKYRIGFGAWQSNCSLIRGRTRMESGDYAGAVADLQLAEEGSQTHLKVRVLCLLVLAAGCVAVLLKPVYSWRGIVFTHSGPLILCHCSNVA